MKESEKAYFDIFDMMTLIEDVSRIRVKSDAFSISGNFLDRVLLHFCNLQQLELANPGNNRLWTLKTETEFKTERFYINAGSIINEIDFLDFLNKMKNVKELSLNFDILENLQKFIKSILKMPHLESLFIQVNRCNDHHFTGLFEILISSDHLLCNFSFYL